MTFLFSVIVFLVVVGAVLYVVRQLMGLASTLVVLGFLLVIGSYLGVRTSLFPFGIPPWLDNFLKVLEFPFVAIFTIFVDFLDFLQMIMGGG